MDPQLLFASVAPLQSHQQQHLTNLILAHLTPYAILFINYLLFQMLRSLVNNVLKNNNNNNNESSGSIDWRRFLNLLANELISTSELCADCAELNVVYELHGTYAYGVALFMLTYLWIDTFGEAYTSPGYLLENCLFQSDGAHHHDDHHTSTSKSGDTYARFLGQSAAMPLAWRLASAYWRYELIDEHRRLVSVAAAAESAATTCKSSLTTSTLNGFLIELTACLVCRLAELIGHKLLAKQWASRRLVSAACSFLCSLLVVLALELSGGYFNPILAASLEFGCQGIELHQHALVFWLGPLVGHLLARIAFKHYEATTTDDDGKAAPNKADRRQMVTRSRAQQQQRVSFGGSPVKEQPMNGRARRKVGAWDKIE